MQGTRLVLGAGAARAVVQEGREGLPEVMVVVVSSPSHQLWNVRPGLGDILAVLGALPAPWNQTLLTPCHNNDDHFQLFPSWSGGRGARFGKGGGSLGEMLLVTTVLSKSGWGLGAGGGGGALLPHIYSPRLSRSAPQLSPALQSSLLAALR